MLVAVIALSASSCGSSRGAATVNGTTISRTTLDNELSLIRRNTAALTQLEEQGPIAGNAYDGLSAAFVDQVLSNEIQAVLVADAVRARHLAVPLAEATVLSAGGGFESYPPSYRRIIAERTADRLALAAQLSGVSIAPATVKTYYRDHVTDFSQYCVSGLVVGSKQQAVAVRDQLLGGADLAATAKAESVDPNTASDGGILGCSDLSDFPALASTITSLPVGQLSQPVQVGLVWYVIKVSKLQVLPLNQAEPTIVQDLLTQYGPFNTFLSRALAGAKVSVDPRYGSFDRSVNPPAVVPR